MSGPHERRRLLRTKYNIPTPALFLDRDGVLIEERHYLCDPNEVSLCPGSKELVQTAHEMKWAIVIVTNQSGIARGFFGWPDYERVTDRMLKLLGTSAPWQGSMPTDMDLMQQQRAGANPAQPCYSRLVGN